MSSWMGGDKRAGHCKAAEHPHVHGIGAGRWWHCLLLPGITQAAGHQVPSSPRRPMNPLGFCREHLPQVCLNSWHLLVVFSRDVKSPKEDVCIAQVAVCSPLGCFVPKLLGNSQALQQTQINELQLALPGLCYTATLLGD